MAAAVAAAMAVPAAMTAAAAVALAAATAATATSAAMAAAPMPRLGKGDLPPRPIGRSAPPAALIVLVPAEVSAVVVARLRIAGVALISAARIVAGEVTAV